MLSGLFKALNRNVVNQFQGIPGPDPWFLLGNLPDLVTLQPFERLLQYGEQYGDVTLFWLFSKPNIFVNNPDLIENILVTNREAYYKNAPGDATRPVLRSDMFIANGADWAAKRPTHPFVMPGRDERFDQMLPEIRRLLVRHYENLAKQKSVRDFYDAQVDLFFYVFGRAVLNSDMSPELLAAFKKIMAQLSRRMQGRAYLPNFSFQRRVKDWFDYFINLMNQRQQQGAPAGFDNLSFQLSTGTALTFDEMRDQLSAAFVAGANPVATTLVSSFYLLQKHPDIKRKLEDELVDFAARSSDGYDLAAISQLQYLDMFISEVLRMYSTVPLFLRQVSPGDGVKIKNYAIPEETPIWFSSYALHRNAKYWPEPEKFDPERFQETPSPYRFFPFGAGPRECVGKPFALLCLKVALIEILPSFEVEFESNYRHALETNAGFSSPKGRVNAKVMKR